METYKRLLLANRAWAHEKAELKPGFFDMLARGQNPDFLWLGCSDSRVPAEEITGVEPGEIFVHRNIANQFHANDANASSVVQYAVEVLKVKHIIVCGHYGCGGVRASLGTDTTGVIDEWLSGIRSISAAHKAQLESLPLETRLEKLVELSVQAQIQNLSKNMYVRKAWETRGAPLLHGWVFGLQDGLLRTFGTLGPDNAPA